MREGEKASSLEYVRVMSLCYLCMLTCLPVHLPWWALGCLPAGDVFVKGNLAIDSTGVTMRDNPKCFKVE